MEYSDVKESFNPPVEGFEGDNIEDFNHSGPVRGQVRSSGGIGRYGVNRGNVVRTGYRNYPGGRGGVRNYPGGRGGVRNYPYRGGINRSIVRPARYTITRPSNIAPRYRSGLLPVHPPANIPRRNWWNWWRTNRHLYGNRYYYTSLGYPTWWLNYYYPELDDDYYDNYDYPYTLNYLEPYCQNVIQQENDEERDQEHHEEQEEQKEQEGEHNEEECQNYEIIQGINSLYYPEFMTSGEAKEEIYNILPAPVTRQPGLTFGVLAGLCLLIILLLYLTSDKSKFTLKLNK